MAVWHADDVFWESWAPQMFTERREFAVGHRLYSGAELAVLLRQAGFGSVTLYGGLAGGPYDHTAQRLATVAHKPGEL